MAGVHGLEHGVGLCSPALADDDAVGALAQRRAEVVVERHLAGTLCVGLARLQAQHVFVLPVDQELAGVLDGDDALFFGDGACQDVEQGGLAAARASADEYRAARCNAGQEELHLLLRGARTPHELVCSEHLLAEAPDVEAAPVRCHRVDGPVEARAVWQAGVFDGVGVVDAAALAGADAVHDAAHVLFSFEAHLVAAAQHAAPLDPDLVGAPVALLVCPRTVDHDLGDARVCQEGLQWPEVEELVDEVLDELLLLFGADVLREGGRLPHGVADEQLDGLVVCSRQGYLACYLLLECRAEPLLELVFHGCS